MENAQKRSLNPWNLLQRARLSKPNSFHFQFFYLWVQKEQRQSKKRIIYEKAGPYCDGSHSNILDWW
jgi:hypothetical protein